MRNTTIIKKLKYIQGLMSSPIEEYHRRSVWKMEELIDKLKAEEKSVQRCTSDQITVAVKLPTKGI